ncbi:ATP-binding protein [Actinosynnema sp. CS-041913]|uniref:ATP-binding protein n=1 Tax=Actinosynnema sp. CS-041913 TaxID=3239917 RepID=UPI003D932C24
MPPSSPRLIGRDETLRALDRLLAEVRQHQFAGVIVVDGQAGVGKTTVAVTWAHRVKDRFPDGVFFIDLHGHAADVTPLDPNEVLEDFLRVLGIQPADIPSGVERRAAQLRTLLDGTRTLIVLDNTAEEGQVRPLIPAARECLVLVTSRKRLSGLAIHHDARCVTVAALDPGDGLVLLREVVGADRVDAEAEAAETIVRFCGGLPLAVRVAAERVAAHPHLTLDALATELSSMDRRLDALSPHHGDDTVRAVFSWTYRALPHDEARLFRLIGLHPGTAFSREAAAALSGLPPTTAERLLERLVAVHLVDEIGPRRYRQHDLLKAYSAERAHVEDSEKSRSAANLRLLDWYLHTAYLAAYALSSHRSNPDLDPPTEGVPSGPEAFTYDEALAWYDSELSNLVAAGQRAADVGLHTHAWKLPVGMWDYLYLRKHWTAWITGHTAGLAAAQAGGDRFGTAWVLNNLANAHRERRHVDLAREQLRLALSLRREIGDRTGQAWTLTATGFLELEFGLADRAARLFTEAVELFGQVSDLHGEATALASLGEAHRVLGDADIALRYLGRALELKRAAGDRYGEGFCLVKLGATYQVMGQHAEALHHFDLALTARARIGDRWGQAEALLGMGHSHLATGDTDHADAAWHEALTIFDELGDPHAAEVRAQLDVLPVPAQRQEIAYPVGPSSDHL